jgi:hypothetical protein
VQRGLLQYDGRDRRYDLHPVMRGVAAGGLKTDERDRYGQQVVDHFTAQPHNPYAQARTLADVAAGVQVVRTLVKLERWAEALRAYRGDVANALRVNLEAHTETLSLLRPFFPQGWIRLPEGLETSEGAYLANDAAMALGDLGETGAALEAYGAATEAHLKQGNWPGLRAVLGNMAGDLLAKNRLAAAGRLTEWALDLAGMSGDAEDLFMARLFWLSMQIRWGRWAAAAATWRLLDPMGRSWSRGAYRQGIAEHGFALGQWWQGTLRKEHLERAARLAEADGDSVTVRALLRLRGDWHLAQGDWPRAAEAYQAAVEKARERRRADWDAEIGLAWAIQQRGKLGTAAEARHEAERLSREVGDSCTLARLWHALGEPGRAREQALAAYRWAWADGEPYVHRYDLTEATKLLTEWGIPVPVLPPYDPAKDEPLPWEAKVRAAIDQAMAEKAAKEKEKEKEKDEKRKKRPKADGGRLKA